LPVYRRRQVVTLKDGKQDSTSSYGNKNDYRIVGTPITGDLNSDGQKDYAVVITQKTDGDVGVYYYAAVALADEKTGVIAGTVAVPLGDRIVIQNSAIVNQAFRLNYLDWKPTVTRLKPIRPNRSPKPSLWMA